MNRLFDLVVSILLVVLITAVLLLSMQIVDYEYRIQHLEYLMKNS